MPRHLTERNSARGSAAAGSRFGVGTARSGCATFAARLTIECRLTYACTAMQKAERHTSHVEAALTTLQSQLNAEQAALDAARKVRPAPLLPTPPRLATHTAAAATLDDSPCVAVGYCVRVPHSWPRNCHHLCMLHRSPRAQAEQGKAKEVTDLRAERGALADKVAAVESSVRALEADKASDRHQLEQHRVRPCARPG